MTVEELIEELKQLPPDATVEASFYPNSSNREPVSGVVMVDEATVEIV